MADEKLPRRDFLKGAGAGAAGAALATAAIPRAMDAQAAPAAAARPAAPEPETWLALTPTEVEFVKAAVDTIIPADELTPSGTDVGLAVFIDRQLAGPSGRNGAFYMMGPFQEGTRQQGPQSALTTAQQQYERR